MSVVNSRLSVFEHQSILFFNRCKEMTTVRHPGQASNVIFRCSAVQYKLTLLRTHLCIDNLHQLKGNLLVPALYHNIWGTNQRRSFLAISRPAQR
jgi:hypothetical protein